MADLPPVVFKWVKPRHDPAEPPTGYWHESDSLLNLSVIPAVPGAHDRAAYPAHITDGEGYEYSVEQAMVAVAALNAAIAKLTELQARELKS
jgi:hypothetical protein